MAGILDSVNQRTQLVGQNRLELESLANDVFADTLTMGGAINSFTP